jgi:uncharacterized protein YjbI with pentapeptide repeats
MKTEELKEILEQHALWLKNEGGERADLYNADLYNADLYNTDLYNANLYNANLYNANLRYANLSDANLYNCIGNGQQIKTIIVEKHIINYTKDVLQIGCKRYAIEKWKNFTDEEISEMDNGALEWWKKWKDWIFKTIEMSTAEV